MLRNIFYPKAFTFEKKRSETLLRYCLNIKFSTYIQKQDQNFLYEKLDQDDVDSIKRCDKYIQKKFGLNWNSTQALFREKKVVVLSQDEKVISKDSKYHLKEGDILKYPKSLSERMNRQDSEDRDAKKFKTDNNLSKLFQEMIVFENENFFVINKLPNISSQGGSEVKLNLSFLTNNHLACVLGEDYDPNLNLARIVHRLDKNTTGLMVIAKNKKFAQDFSKTLREHSDISKIYYGLLDGIPSNVIHQLLTNLENPIIDEKGFINAELTYNEKDMKMELKEGSKRNSNSKTFFEIIGLVQRDLTKNNDISRCWVIPENHGLDQKNDVILNKIFEDYKNINERFIFQTLVKFKIQGGKKHQIRAHSSLVLGCPIVMDNKYGYISKFNIHEFILNNIELRTISKTSFSRVEGKESPSRYETINFEEKEKHYLKALLQKEFLFLHSHTLEFSNEITKYSFHADFPPHFKLMLKPFEAQGFIL